MPALRVCHRFGHPLQTHDLDLRIGDDRRQRLGDLLCHLHGSLARPQLLEDGAEPNTAEIKHTNSANSTSGALRPGWMSCGPGQLNLLLSQLHVCLLRVCE
eukprot:352077-Pyramimonas_sp.AAC.1